MKDPILVGHGDGGDVAPSSDGTGWTVAWIPVLGGQRQDLRLSKFDWDGFPLSYIDVFTGTHAGGVWPRLVPAGDFLWLAQRAITNEQLQIALRRVHADGSISTDGVYGRSDAPHALSGDWLAWQDIPANRVYGRYLPTAAPVTEILRVTTRPTGLSHMDGPTPVFWDDNRMSVLGMYNPVRSLGMVVGEGYSGGVVVRLGGPPGTLLPWQLTQTPRGRQFGGPTGPCAATYWNSDGVWLLPFSPADVTEAAGSTVADRPDVLGEGASQ